MNESPDQETTEVRETNAVEGNTRVQRQSVATSRQVSGGVIARRVIYYIASIIIALLALRVVLLLLGASQESAFVDFVYAISGFFAWPFYGIFSYQPSYGQSTFELSSVIAIIVYALIAAGLAKLFTLTSSRTDV